MTAIECRPGDVRASIPREWQRRYGLPPERGPELRAWLLKAIRGAPAPSADASSAALLAEVDAALAGDDGLERRSAATMPRPAHVSARGAQQPSGPRLRGLGIVFSTPELIADAWLEEWTPGAFDRQRGSARGWNDVYSTAQHAHRDLSQWLGSVRAGTLKLDKTPVGVVYEVVPPANGAGPLVIEMAQRGDFGGSSFTFTDVIEEWTEVNDTPYRQVLEARLIEIGPVTRPAFELTGPPEVIGGSTSNSSRMPDLTLASARRILEGRARRDQAQRAAASLAMAERRERLYRRLGG